MVQVIKYNLNTSQIICIYNICKNQQTINSNNTVQLYIFKKKIMETKDRMENEKNKKMKYRIILN